MYLVSDPINGAKFALKRQRIQLKEHEAGLKREIQAHTIVRESKYVVSLLDSFVDPGNEGLLLLPFFSNGTCQDLIEKGPRPIPLEKILAIARDICKGLCVR